MVLRLEILIFIFIRSHREGNFPLYVETLEALVPWFFALDHTNYARWVPVHIRDMKSLPSAVSKDLQKYWVVAKTKRLVPEAEGWGWTCMDNTWKPVWMTLPEAVKACLELLKCGCRQGCASRCAKANLPCTELCQCSGECSNNSDS